MVVPVSLLLPVMSKGMMEHWKGCFVSHLRAIPSGTVVAFKF
jgi:hypothetical protein